MKLSETAEFFISRCYEGGEVRMISPLFNSKYHIKEGEILHKFTKEVLDEMVESGRVIVKFESDKMVNIAGLEGMSL